MLWLIPAALILVAFLYWFFKDPPCDTPEPAERWPEPESLARGYRALPAPLNRLSPPPLCGCRSTPPPLTPADSLSPYEQKIWTPPATPPEEQMKDIVYRESGAPPPAPRLVIPSRAKKSVKRKATRRTRK